MPVTRTTAVALAALIALSPAARASASQRQTASSPARSTATAATGDPVGADETRQRLEQLFKQYPPTLPHILRMDPTLLDNQAYLTPYPALSAFLAQHAEIKHNPTYFFAEYAENSREPWRPTPQDRAVDMWRNVIQGFTIATVLLAVAGGVIWLIKNFIDYRRWTRMSKVQADVHNKLMDRFTSNEELMAYIQTPAGRRFFDSAPISMDTPLSAPVGRILWSAQAGAVLAVLGIGLEVVAHNALEEIAPPLAAVGAVVIALGMGFVVSSILAYVLSRRFGLLTKGASAENGG
jgi:hypothetical protein